MKKRIAWSIYVFVCMILLLCGSITVHAKGVYEEPGSISSSHNWANPVKCHTVYYGKNVPLFRRNGYRESGAGIPHLIDCYLRVYSLNAGSNPYTSLMDL